MYNSGKIIQLILLVIACSTLLMAQPEAPTLVQPTNGSQCEPLDNNFDWSHPNVGVLDYRLQISTESGNYSSTTSVVLDETPIQVTDFDFDLGENSQTYYWRAGARYSNTLMWSEEFMFVTQRSGTTITLPSDNSTCIDTTATVSFLQLDNVDSYEVQVSVSPNFTTVENTFNSTTSTNVDVAFGLGFTEYFVRTRAEYTSSTATCNTEWSEPISIRSRIFPPQPAFPGDGQAGIDFNTSLTWEPEAGAVNYDLQLADVSDFDGGSLLRDEQNLTSTSFDISVDPTLYDKEYFWRIRANDASATCTSDWSETFTFVTQLQSTTLSQPEDESVCVELLNQTFSWEFIASSNTFQFQLADNRNFVSPELDITNISSNSITVDIAGDNQVYFWRVRANSGDNVSKWTEPREFISSIFAPIPESPEFGADDQFIAVNLEWANPSAYTNQMVQVATDPSFDEDDIVIEEDGVPDSEFLAVLPEYGTTYYWRVSSTLGECRSGFSNPAEFTVYDGFPDLNLPEDDANNLPTTVQFDWDDVPGATGYDIEISKFNDFSIIEKGRIDVPTSVITISDFEEFTVFYWRVRSVNQYSKSPWSEVFTYQTGQEDANKPATLYPRFNEEMVPTSIDFLWKPSANAEEYELQISEDENFASLIFSKDDIEDTTFSFSGLENYRFYYWRVRGINQTTNSPWSAYVRFRTIADEVSDAPNLFSPSDMADELSPAKITFEWGSIPNTLQVEGGYQLQVASTNDFEESNLIYDQRNIFREDPTLFALLPLTTHYWRVRGWNEAGDGPWSQVFSFTTIDPSSVNQNINIKLLDIFPNPTVDELNINIDLNEAGPLEYMIFDMNGAVVNSGNFGMYSNGIQNLQISNLNLATGRYILMLKNGNSIITHNFSIAK